MDVTDYDVISTQSLGELVKMVRAAIREGWTPLGGVSMSEGTYLQAIVK